LPTSSEVRDPLDLSTSLALFALVKDKKTSIPIGRTVSGSQVISSTQKSTREPPENVTVKGLINHETDHHRFAFDADVYCWMG
jgi:hypothetical protein